MSISISEYFQRQTAIPEIGTKGLERLQEAKIAVVGVGGVGAAAAEYLAKSGIGHLKLIDQDIVESSNLHRLSGVSQEYLYHPKAEVVAEILAKTISWTDFDPVVDTLRASNVNDLLEGVDLIVDGLDNFRTRYYLNNYSRLKKTPYIFTSAIATQGHVGLFAPPETACLECVFPSVTDRPEESCEVLGIAPAVVGLVGAIAASEAVKLLLEIPTKMKGSLLTVDFLGPEFLVSQVSRREDCEACTDSKKPADTSEGVLTMLCGEKTYNVVPQRPMSFDLWKTSRTLPPENILRSTGSVLVYRREEFVISLFRTGRMMIGGVNEGKRVLNVAKEVWENATRETGQPVQEVFPTI